MNYVKLSKSQIDKVGNSLIYFSEKIEDLTKTKALKLIYILDELSIKKSGIPFFNLKYKVWKFGPVSEEIFIDLSTEVTLLKDFIERSLEDDVTLIKKKIDFNDDEFSDNDIDLLDFVVDKFGNKNAKQLISYTHRKNSPWYLTALENSVLTLLEHEEINNTDYLIDMGLLIKHDERKTCIFNDYVETH